MLITRRLLLGAVGTLPLARLVRGATAHRLTILHVNDFHSRHEPVDPRAMTCTADKIGGEKGGCFGGSPRLATAIREQRRAAEADGRTVVLLDGGDQFQGSLFYNANHGMAELAVQHAVGTDAMAVGNHEFDNGPGVLARYVAAAAFPVLSANVDAADDPDLRGLLHPYTILRRGGLRLGVVGLTTREALVTSSPGPHVDITDPRPALLAAIAACRAEGVDAIIVLSHLGLPSDVALRVPGVALVVGGHTHTLLSNTEPGAQGPDPTPGTDATPIVQAGAYGRYLGRVDLDLAEDGTVLALAAACRHVGLDLVPDPAVAAIVARFAAPIAALRARRVTTLATALDVGACRVAQCRFGTIAAEAMRAAVHGASVGLMNAGGLRVGLPPGPLSYGQVLEAMPFGNTLASLTLTGADLAAAAMHGLSMVGRGGFPQWAGLRARGLPPGLEVEHPDGTWAPLDRTALYLVATNNFVRNGGDGYIVLRDRAIDPYDTGPSVAELVAAALENGAAQREP